MLLQVENLTVRYEKAVLLNGISMGVDTGELVSLVGPNGAGKSTALRAITGLVSWEKELKRRSTTGDISLEGTVTFAGERIDRIPAHEIVKRGLVHCPERRRPFREMTVFDNLLAGAYLQKEKKKIQQDLDKVYTLFPVLKERAHQISGTLSGGEQQMLAIGRALMSEPKLLCIDEPSTGLAPLMRKEVFEKIAEINRLGITVLLVEQEVSTVFKMASRNYVLSSGKIIAEGPGEQLLQDEVLRKTYLGL
jgi:branched-chain amino acid transport system ATP-binding protein